MRAAGTGGPRNAPAGYDATPSRPGLVYLGL